MERPEFDGGIAPGRHNLEISLIERGGGGEEVPGLPTLLKLTLLKSVTLKSVLKCHPPPYYLRNGGNRGEG